MAGIGVQINVPAPVISVPAPGVTVGVPDTYAWDGTEYVGLIGSQYYYLGPGDVWLPMDQPRLVRFHEWEHHHSDWRDHAIRNTRYRNDAHGHAVPLRDTHDSRGPADVRDSHDYHGDEHAHDAGHDHDHH